MRGSTKGVNFLNKGERRELVSQKPRAIEPPGTPVDPSEPAISGLQDQKLEVTSSGRESLYRKAIDEAVDMSLRYGLGLDESVGYVEYKLGGGAVKLVGATQ